LEVSFLEIKDLPQVEELQARYREYNERYFENILPREITIEWSKRMTSAAGSCNYRKKIIKISVWYHLKYPEEIDNTLLHEMIHLIVPGHGPKFKAYLIKLQEQGANVSRHSKEKAKDPRWLYVCPKCQTSFKSYNRYLNLYICRHCKSNFKEYKLNDFKEYL
jgi:predicted SprT family Zn-dependent metalloprotease